MAEKRLPPLLRILNNEHVDAFLQISINKSHANPLLPNQCMLQPFPYESSANSPNLPN
jgi:hypothetical protein